MKKIYVPKIFFELDGDQKDIADVIFQGYYDKKDAQMIYPNIDIIEMEVEERPLPSDN